MDQQIDLKKIDSVPHHQMLAIMNQYLIGSADHINKVADFAQKQMINIDFMIDSLQAKVQILQKKLGIEQVKPQNQIIQKKQNQ